MAVGAAAAAARVSATEVLGPGGGQWLSTPSTLVEAGCVWTLTPCLPSRVLECNNLFLVVPLAWGDGGSSPSLSGLDRSVFFIFLRTP